MSCTYHITPVVEKAVESPEKFGVTRGGVLTRLASVGTRALGGFLLRPDEAEVKRADAVVRGMYQLLKGAGVEFGLLDKEIYSGALLYELGFADDFAKYTKRVAEHFQTYGVRKIITVDPHTHYVLEKIYPRYVEGFNVEVVSYLDLLDAAKIRAKISGFAIHDSCLYARFLGEVPWR
jgi:Fe-S oxidoreductase